MNLNGLYPDPPHLNVTAWSSGPEQATFTAVTRAVEAAGGTATGVASTAPAYARFGRMFDLAGADGTGYLPPHPVGDRLAGLIDGSDPAERALQVGYVAGKLTYTDAPRLVVVQYDEARPDEPHPVVATIDGDLLGIPDELWEDEEPARARELSAWILSLFKDVQERTASLYGSIEVERDVPSPALLREGGGLSTVLYLADALTQAVPDLLDGVRELNPGAEETVWPTGRFLCSWAPMRQDGGPTVPEESELARACGILIGEAVERYLTLHPAG